MAIAYQSISISGASSAVSGATAQTAIRDALTGHASGAWTLVEEFDSSGATCHWVVLKNDKTLSDNTVDFYVGIGRIAATGQLCVLLGEVYTTATHTFGTVVPYPGSSNNILSDFAWASGSGSSPTSFALGTTFPPTSAANPLGIQPGNASTMRFVTAVEKDYAIINLVTTTIYIGALTDLIVPDATLSAATPIGLCDLFNNNIGPFGGLTRHPINVADAPLAVGYSHALYPIVGPSFAWLQASAFGTALYLNPDRYQGNRVAACELAAVMYAGNGGSGPNSTPAKVGALRGKFKGVRLVSYPLAAVLYDQIVVDGRKHIILKDGGSLNSLSNFTLFPYDYASKIHWGFSIDTGVAA